MLILKEFEATFNYIMIIDLHQPTHDTIKYMLGQSIRYIFVKLALG
jgi:hypothetical protein